MNAKYRLDFFTQDNHLHTLCKKIDLRYVPSMILSHFSHMIFYIYKYDFSLIALCFLS